MKDIDDLVAARLTNNTDYYIVKSFAKTFADNGLETGYVSDDGNHTPSTSRITKRQENADGVVFNVDDFFTDISAYVYPAARGRVSLYISRKSGVTGTPTCKAITEYHHNFKEFELNASAKISTVGFKATGELSVTYSAVNKTWQRASGGKTLS